MTFLRKTFCSINFWIFLLMLFLTIFGCIMVYSASCYSAQKNFSNQHFFLIKQIIGVGLGLCGFVFFSYFDYKKLAKYKYVLVVISIILLLLVFVPKIGIENYGAKRWIGFGGFSFQPSEIAKFAFVIFASAHLSKRYNVAKKFSTILPVIIVGVIFCFLIIIEPNMSITMCMGAIMVIMLICGGIKLKHLIFLCIPILILIPLLIIIEPYRLSRLMAFIDPWQSPKGEGFQLIQSLYSLANGGLFGVGLFSSRQKYLYLPFAESDFIFSIIGEELGFFGSTIIVLIYAVLIVLLIKVALNCTNRFASLICTGIASIISVQVLLNIAVVTGSIPPTGLPLPFISAGSTSLIVFMSAIGICININKQNEKYKRVTNE